MAEDFPLPRPPFLWTMDQIATLLSVPEERVASRYIYYEHLTSGTHAKDHIKAVNIAILGDDPEWRVSETELIRWLRYKGFKPRYFAMT
jgi:hypothetical protein